MLALGMLIAGVASSRGIFVVPAGMDQLETLAAGLARAPTLTAAVLRQIQPRSRQALQLYRQTFPARLDTTTEFKVRFKLGNFRRLLVI